MDCICTSGMATSGLPGSTGTVGFAELPADDVHVFTMNFAHLAEWMAPGGGSLCRRTAVQGSVEPLTR